MWKGVDCVLLKMCRCGKVIPQSLKLCEQCNAVKVSRHMEYNKYRRSKASKELYESKEWKLTRAKALSLYDGIDIYALYVKEKLEFAEEVHHIVDAAEDDGLKFDLTNLIPLTHNNHTHITKLYKQSEVSKIATQKLLRKLVKKHFEEVGGIEKVLERF